MGRLVAAAFAAALLVAVMGSGAGASVRPAAKAAAGTSSYIVVLNDATDAAVTTAALEKRGGFTARYKYKTALKGFAANLSSSQLQQLRADPRVNFISADGVVQAVGSYVPIAPGDFAPTGVRRIGAAIGQTQVKVQGATTAVIDTGVDLNHTDLNVTSGTNCITPGNPAQDDNSHGTHVAGTIGARNQGSDVVGVAPGTKIFAVKVLNSGGSGTFAQVICGIDWVAAHGPGTKQNIKVANMSLGGGGSDDGNCGNSNSDAMHKAICNAVNTKGVTFVVAAGNNGGNMATFVPAAYDETLTATAIADSDGLPGGTGGPPSCRPSEQDDKFASFSNFAVTAADQGHTIAAPGVCILSDRLGGGTIGTFSGTSMASPHVAGSVALCIGPKKKKKRGACYGMTPAQIRTKLRNDAATHATMANGFIGDPNHPVPGEYFGFLVEASDYPKP
jgi:subtilisin family serine protease